MLSLIRNILVSIAQSTRDLIPIILVIALFQIFVIQQPFPQLEKILTGTVLVILGLMLFIKGLENY